MNQDSVRIAFPDETRKTAGLLIEDLEDEIKKEVKADTQPVKTEIRREDPEAQDFGTTLAVVLGTPAVIVLAKAIRDWAKRKDQASIEINGARIKNVSSADVADIVAAIQGNEASSGAD